ncbi:MAG: glycosyltransferase family 4 protein [Phycisphaerales bacterium]
MTHTPCDACVLCLPDRVSLTMWHRAGRLDQQRPLLERLAESPRGLVVVADHDPKDEEIAERLPANTRLVGFDPRADVGAATLDALGPGLRDLRIVVRTHQLHDGGASARIAGALRAQGAIVGRIARGGHVRSRFIARELGPDAPEARTAGQIERELCLTSDLVVGTTGKMVDDLAWRWGLSADRTRVIPNFIDDDQPIGEPDEREPGRVLIVGPLLAHKNTDMVVRAIGAMPRAARGSVSLELIGDGPEAPRLRALADELDVHMVHEPSLPHAAVLGRMRTCSAYVQASSYEQHPISLIEAMGAGAAVIVANSPGLGVVIDNGVSGVLVPGGPESFTYALSGVLEDDGWREMLGRSAAVAARRRFGITHVAALDAEAMTTAIELGAQRLRRAG